MPLYEYTCLNCKERFELLRSHSERDEACECPECSKVKKHLRGVSLFSAGSGSSTSGGGCGPSPSGSFG